MKDNPIHYRETKYGFEYGAAKVTRITSEQSRKAENVYIGVSTTSPNGIVKHSATVRVTKTGQIRLFLDGKELTKRGKR